MGIDPIAPLNAGIEMQATGSLRAASGLRGADSGSFSAALVNAIEQVESSLATADDLAVRLAAGENVELHQVMFALETATIGLQTMLEVRNRAFDAYKEIMAIQL